MFKMNRIALASLAVAAFSSALSAQQVEIKWIQSPNDKPKLVRGQSLFIKGPTKIKVVVTDVNDFLYGHVIKTTLVPKTFDDAALALGGFQTANQKKAGGGCTSFRLSEQLLESALNIARKESEDRYITRSEMSGRLKEVKKYLEPLKADKSYDSCRGEEDKKRDTQIEEFGLAPHTVSAEVELNPAFDLEIEVSASREKGGKTVGPVFKVTIGTVTNQLSLSLGILATTLEDRTYSARNSANRHLSHTLPESLI